MKDWEYYAMQKDYEFSLIEKILIRIKFEIAYRKLKYTYYIKKYFKKLFNKT